jgi:hypothetical protein
MEIYKKERCPKCGHLHQPVGCYYCGLPVLFEVAIKIHTGVYGEPLAKMFRKPWICWHNACFALDPDGNDLKRISEQQEASRVSAKAQAKAPTNAQDESACFIAGATYGSQCAPEVLRFRAFRDRYLATTRRGRLFIAIYNRFSPPLAQVVAKRNFPRTVSRAILNLLSKIIPVD